ncbi:MAG TPA: Gfo/Idh/MocA family oxidoreductase [Syntrophales bacterium]|nr:Gfo/Idh/MocA family oxidoreductase [Syntrophales bacterium]
MQLSAVVIGLGRIGQGYDYDLQGDRVIATHATAYMKHPGYRLLAAVDPDPLQRIRFEEKFQCPAYADLPSLMESHEPDVISLAVPSGIHCDVFREAVRFRPRAILCEKPIALSSADGLRMQALADEVGCVLAVNYMRRFEPAGAALKGRIESGQFGSIFKGVAWYAKGLFNNGSHFIDLLRFWLGEVTDADVIRPGRLRDDHDPEPDVCLHFGEIPVYLLAGRDEHYSIGGIDLYGTGGMIRYAEGGNTIELRRTEPSPLFSGYTILDPNAEIISTDLKRYQWYVLEGLYNHLTRNEKLPSDGVSATETLAVIEKIADQRNWRRHA